MLIRVPFYNPRKFVHADKYKPMDEREIEDVDPVLNIPKIQQTCIRVGVPVFLKDLYDPKEEKFEGYKYTEETDKDVLKRMVKKGQKVMDDQMKDARTEQYQKVASDHFQQIPETEFTRPPLLNWKQAVKAHKIQNKIAVLKEMKDEEAMKKTMVKHSALLRKSDKNIELIKLKYVRARAAEIQKQKRIPMHEAMAEAETNLMAKI